ASSDRGRRQAKTHRRVSGCGIQATRPSARSSSRCMPTQVRRPRGKRRKRGMKNWFTPRVVGLAVVVASAAVIGGAAIGAVLADDTVKTFTGCLAQNDGMITKVKEGDTPKSACAPGQTLVRVSGGDITSVNVQEGGGLTGGGTNGAVSLSLR